MSLHKFADMVAKQGRGEDSLLIHMTPDEVQRLQKFAEANGRSLTINPETGLPEAGMLSDLFKAVAPIALGAFLGPAGFGLSATMAGVATGGITALATGSLSRGLMAGLGAYGGAGLGDSLMNAGANTAGNVAGALGVEGAATGAGSQAAMLAAQNAGFGAEGLSSLANSAGVAAGAAPVVPSTSSLLSSGFNAATASPSAMGQFAKDNWKSLAAAATPIMAGAMVPTTTKMPEDTNPAYIRQKLYDPYTQTFKSLAPVKASEWGSRNFSDAYTNPQTGQMATLDVRKPEPMAGGGIVALAIGGDTKTALEAAYAANDVNKINEIVSANKITAADVADTYKGFDTSGIKGLQLYSEPAANATPTYFQQNKDVADAYAQNSYGMTPDEFAQTHYDKYGKTEGRTLGGAGADVGAGIAAIPAYDAAAEKLYQETGSWDAAAKARDTAANASNTAMWNKQNADMWSAQAAERDAAAAKLTADAAATNKQNLLKNTEDWIAKNPFATKEQIAKIVKDAGMSDADVQSTLDSLVASGKVSSGAKSYLQGEGLSRMGADTAKWLKDNPNATQKEIDDVLKAAKLSQSDAQQVLAHGYQVAEDKNSMAAAMKYLTENKDVARWVSSAQGQAYLKEHPEFDAKDIAYTHYKRYGEAEGRKWGLDVPKAPAIANGYYGNKTTDPRTTTPGDIITNPDRSVTVTPNVPGRPTGGFPGMGAVRDAYTAGGGSLGYTSPVPKTIDEFNTMYNQQTGDSLAAYNYLMGKGGAKYPTQSVAASTGINRPYWTGAMRYKQKFLTSNEDGTVTSSETNPNAPKAKGAAGAAKSIEVTDYNGESPQTYTAVLQEDGTYLAGNGKRYDASGKEMAAGGGAMGYAQSGMPSYAVGGGLGSLGGYSDGGRLLKGPGDGVSDSIPATIGAKRQPARLADGEFVIPARIVSELGNGSTDAGAKKLYAMMDRVQRARGKTTGKNKVAANSRADKHLPA